MPVVEQQTVMAVLVEPELVLRVTFLEQMLLQATPVQPDRPEIQEALEVELLREALEIQAMPVQPAQMEIQEILALLVTLQALEILVEREVLVEPAEHQIQLVPIVKFCHITFMALQLELVQ
jgi:hypothetical protein